MHIDRALEERLVKSKKSALLLGPRQTGKSTLLRKLTPDLIINLAHERTFVEFNSNPAELEQRLMKGRFQKIFIDEIQRLPSLTNTIQALIDDNPRLQFLLSGSSARKLKHDNANLLPGRVISYELFPLTWQELGNRFNLMRALEIGLLPGVYLNSNRAECEEVLLSYVGTYLREEVQAEARVRNLEGFSRFLNVAAAHSGSFLDFSKLASMAQIPRQTAVRFFELLEDTLLVRAIHCYAQDDRRRFIKHPKYYFFDLGVINGLLGNFTASADRIGPLFETFIFNQIHAALTNRRRPFTISTLRTYSDVEVDLVLRTEHALWAIECKATKTVAKHDLRGLNLISDYIGKPLKKRLLYTGNVSKEIDGVIVQPWQEGLEEMVG